MKNTAKKTMIIISSILLISCSIHKPHYISLTYNAKEKVSVINATSLHKYYNLDGYHMIGTKKYITAHSYKIKNINLQTNYKSTTNQLINNAYLRNIDYLGPIECQDKITEITCQAEIFQYGGQKSKYTQVKQNIIDHKHQQNINI
jgi:hypothetical protein